jgi:hypothetical protein
MTKPDTMLRIQIKKASFGTAIPRRLPVGNFLKTALICSLLTTAFSARAQFKVGNNPTVIDPAAALQVESPNQGVLLPRINDTAVTPLNGAPDGTVIYFTDSISPAQKTGPAAGFYVRSSNAWQRTETAGNAWSILGNSGTTNANFLGTTDAAPLRLKVNNTAAGIISSSNIVSLGYDGYNGTATKVTAIGSEALKSNTAENNTAVGHAALNRNTTGQYNTALGANAGAGSANVTGNSNVFLGYQSGYNIRGGSSNIAVGANTLYTNQSGNGNVAIGDSVLHNSTSTYNTAVGHAALKSNTNAGANAAFGAFALTSATSMSNTAVGYSSLRNTTSGGNNTATGTSALEANTTGTDNTAIGYLSLSGNTTSSSNTAVGSYALKVSTQPGNTAVGAYALENNEGLRNTAMGYQAARGDGTMSGSYNVAVGYRPMFVNTTGTRNVAVGDSALAYNTTGNTNVAIGALALKNNVTGTNNTAIGYNANVLATDLQNTTVLGYNAKVNRSNSIILGDTANNDLNVGIGRNAPQAKLHVRATTGNNPLILEGTPSGTAADSVLTINSTTGLVGKRSVSNLISSNAWSLRGNSGTTSGDFLGTTDNAPLQFRVNNFSSGQVSMTNTALGFRSLELNEPNEILEKGIMNVAIGVQALLNNISGSHNIAIGNQASVGHPLIDGELNNAIAIGSRAMVRRSNSMVLGDTTLNDFNVGIGRGKPQAKLHVRATSGNNPLILEGLPSGGASDSLLTVNTSGTVGKKTVNSLVSSAAWSLTGNAGTTNANFIGTTDAQPVYFRVANVPSGIVTTGGVLAPNNTALGQYALQSALGAYNVAFGTGALMAADTGSRNTAVGARAMIATKGGGDNAAFGHSALSTNTTGTGNVGIGAEAMSTNTSGSYNTSLGFQSMSGNLTGSYNTAIGTNARTLSTNLEYATAIGANTGVARSHSIVLGDTTDNTLNVGIGRAAPQAKLHVRATSGHNPLILEGTTSGAASDSILTIDNATGIVRKAPASTVLAGAAWSLSGNSGIAPTQFIGTKDTAALRFRTQDVPSGMVNAVNTSLGYGTLLAANSNSWGNVAVGSAALSASPATKGTVAIGVNALLQTTADYNTGVGRDVLKQNTTGTLNVAVGSEALMGNAGGMTGSYNTGLGAGTLRATSSGSLNTAVGYHALYSLTTATQNVAVGDSALYSNTASQNTAVGSKALRSNTTGNQNVAVGYEALRNTTTGVKLVAIGYGALRSNTSGVGNIAIGNKAAESSTIAGNNIAIGDEALASNTATANLAIGTGALASNTNGIQNVGIGHQSLNKNTLAHYNTAVGYQTLENNTGASNTALGHMTMNANTTGKENVGVGDLALRYNTTGDGNVGLGHRALYTNIGGSNNTAVGYYALNSNTTGTHNVGIGYQALMTNSTGNSNVAVGKEAMYSNTLGLNNVAVGNEPLRSNTIGEGNVALGLQALYSNVNGNNNFALGNNALYSNAGGHGNVAIGYRSLRLTTGSGNVGIGSEALTTNTTGTTNTAIGNYADVSTGNLTNATAIGAGAIVNASNKVRIGNSSVLVIEGQVPFTTPSDARFKSNVTDNVPGLSFIKKLKPVTYHFDGRKLDEHMSGKPVKDNAAYRAGFEKIRTGFLAQDVEAICKELGFDFDAVHVPKNENDHYSLSYSQFIMPLVKAVQEQQEMIEQQKAENATLQAKLEAQQQALEAMLKRLEQLEKR